MFGAMNFNLSILHSAMKSLILVQVEETNTLGSLALSLYVSNAVFDFVFSLSNLFLRYASITFTVAKFSWSIISIDDFHQTVQKSGPA